MALRLAISYLKTREAAQHDALTPPNDLVSHMTLKSSFATVLRAIRSKRNITQRQFADTTSRTYLSKLEGGRSSITLDKLDQLSERLRLSPLTLLALTLSEESGKPAISLVETLKAEIELLQQEGGLPGLTSLSRSASSFSAERLPSRSLVRKSGSSAHQAELMFTD